MLFKLSNALIQNNCVRFHTYIMMQKYVRLMTICRLWLACIFLFPLGGLYAMPNSDILLDIVRHCVDPKLENYCTRCRAPIAEVACTPETSCKKTTEVWSSNTEYVAIRDIKMCGCPASFVHGLVMPLQVITGVEDPLRPEGIWQYAWDEATLRMEAEAIALVVNPQNFRSQNQLHVHLVRLKPQARAEFKSMATGTSSNLLSVWKIAAELAKQQNLPDYGVLVSTEESGGFKVVVTTVSPGHLFTQYVCR
jgi:CDP-diacylglycerol pyrophosphatase